MRADSEPNDGRAFHDLQCAVAQANPEGDRVALLIDFLEPEAGVMEVSAEEQVDSSGVPPDFFRQVGECLAKPSSGAGFDQRRSSSGRVSPR